MNREASWTVLLIGGGAAVGKTTVAKAIAQQHGTLVVPMDALWLALKAVTRFESHPELHYFDPSGEDLELPPEVLCQRHVATAKAISSALDPVIEHFLWERQPVVLEGAWITPAAASDYVARDERVSAVFIHEPDRDAVLTAMRERASVASATARQSVLAEVCWRFGMWLREEAISHRLMVIEARPRATLPTRIMDALSD
jgi:2-phosphoglycerate kinase